MTRVAMGMVGCLTLLLGLFGTAKAGKIPGSGGACPANGSTYTVSKALGNADTITEGFNCPAVHLDIQFSLSANLVEGQPQDPVVGPGPGIPVGGTALKLTAATINITSPGDSTDPLQRVQIVDDNAGSEVTLTAVAGDITITGGTIRAHKNTKIICSQTAPPCAFTADDSDLMAATSFETPVAGGGLFFSIVGPISIHTTNVHGGDTMEMESVSSSITLICKTGDTACKDPTAGIPPDIIAAACGNPIQYPCPPLDQPGFHFTRQELKSVCVGVPGVVCNGGHKEKRFTAGTFINFTGSTISSDEHVTFTCKGLGFPAVPNSGDLIASGATFDMDSLIISCKGKVDLSNSKIIMAAHLTVNAGTNCPAGAVCIDVSGANITAKPVRLNTGSGGKIIKACNTTFTVPLSFPSLNGGTSPGDYNESRVLFKPYRINGKPKVDPPDNCPLPNTTNFIQ